MSTQANENKENKFSKILDFLKKVVSIFTETGIFMAMATAKIINTIITGNTKEDSTSPQNTEPKVDEEDLKKMKKDAIKAEIDKLISQEKGPKMIEKQIKKMFHLNFFNQKEFVNYIHAAYLKHQNSREEEIITDKNEEEESFENSSVKEEIEEKEQDNSTTKQEAVKNKIDLTQLTQLQIARRVSFIENDKLFHKYIANNYQEEFKNWNKDLSIEETEAEYLKYCGENNVMPFSFDIRIEVYDYLAKEIQEEKTDIQAVTNAMNKEELPYFNIQTATQIAKDLYIDKIRSNFFDIAKTVQSADKQTNKIIEMKNGEKDGISFFTSGNGEVVVTLYNDTLEGYRIINLEEESDIKLLSDVYYQDFKSEEEFAQIIAEYAIDSLIYENDGEQPSTLMLKSGAEIICYPNPVEENGNEKIVRTFCFSEPESSSASEILRSDAYSLYKNINILELEETVITQERETLEDYIEKMEEEANEVSDIEFINDVLFREEDEYEFN